MIIHTTITVIIGGFLYCRTVGMKANALSSASLEEHVVVRMAIERDLCNWSGRDRARAREIGCGECVERARARLLVLNFSSNFLHEIES
jgi:hypothetical protein